MQADKVNSQGPELLECIYQLAQAASKPVVSVHNNGVHQPFPTRYQQTVQSRTVLFGSANACIRVLTSDLPTSSVAVGSEFLKLHLGILAVARTNSGVDSRKFHGRPPFFPL